MSNFKASTQNFDASYIYKVEEREESEQIVRQSARGLLSIENNELPKVTRYFLKNNKGVCCVYAVVPHSLEMFFRFRNRRDISRRDFFKI